MKIGLKILKILIMKVILKNPIEVVPMNKFDYNKNILKITIQHPENAWVNGYCCYFMDETFFIEDKLFNSLFKTVD